ncbi:VanZ family protein [Eubacterium coprostanoligenes]|uniref:VanZ family protein n=1 Tax=Eubacterium coprostanoligenes TaxID=290054 RepID=UPI002A834213|nr:VanZ family protein [Eubacterium coprostanoligenes]MDY4699215.1 VanZ family protein [Eubacterium coprostanoligenes]
MSTTKNTVLGIKKFSNILFTLAIFFSSCQFLYNYNQHLLELNYKLRWAKILLSVVVPIVVTVIHYLINHDLIYIADRTASVMIIYTFLYIIDSVILRNTKLINGFLSLRQLMYGLETFFSVLAVITLITLIRQKDRELNNHYAESLKAFFSGSIPVMGIGFAKIYFSSRIYGKVYNPPNLIPFNGEMSEFAKSGELELLIRDAGNVLFFTALVIVLLEITKRCKFFWGICLPVAISVSMEFYQYFFKCGDPDIDDVILNTVGAILGCVIYKFIIEKIKENELCWESLEQWMWR